MSVKLSERLSEVYDMVTEGSVVADVGCDHAFLSIALAENKASHVYALDVNMSPLEHARANIDAAGMSEKVTTVRSDGLIGLDELVDSIVICGMGGSLIISILSESISKAYAAKELILSPQSDAAKVREWLRDHGFSLIEERAVIDAGKYYEIIKVSPSKEPSGWGDGSAFTMKYGPYLLEHHDQVLMEHLKKRIGVLEEILGGIDESNPKYEELKGEEVLCRSFVK